MMLLSAARATAPGSETPDVVSLENPISSFPSMVRTAASADVEPSPEDEGTTTQTTPLDAICTWGLLLRSSAAARCWPDDGSCDSAAVAQSITALIKATAASGPLRTDVFMAKPR